MAHLNKRLFRKGIFTNKCIEMHVKWTKRRADSNIGLDAM